MHEWPQSLKQGVRRILPERLGDSLVKVQFDELAERGASPWDALQPRQLKGVLDDIFRHQARGQRTHGLAHHHGRWR